MRTHQFIEIHGETALLVERKVVKAVDVSYLNNALQGNRITSPLLPLNTIHWFFADEQNVYHILRPAGRQKITMADQDLEAVVLTPWNLFIVKVVEETVIGVHHFWMLHAPMSEDEPLYEPCLPSRFGDGHLCLDGACLLDHAPIVAVIDALIDQVMQTVVNQELVDTASQKVPAEFKTLTGSGASLEFKMAVKKWAEWSATVPANPADEREAIQRVHWTPTTRQRAIFSMDKQMTLKETMR